MYRLILLIYHIIMKIHVEQFKTFLNFKFDKKIDFSDRFRKLNS